MFARNLQTRPFVEQWERTDRWWKKLQSAYDSDAPTDEIMDLFYAVLQNVFAMRDWLLHSNINKDKVDTLFSTQHLKLCRDIANGTKHCVITKPSVDADFRTLREYEPASIKSGKRSEVFRVVADGRKYDLYGLALNCMTDIQGFLLNEGLFGANSVVQCGAMAQGVVNPQP